MRKTDDSGHQLSMRTILFSLVLALPGLWAEAPKTVKAAATGSAPAAGATASDSQIESTIRNKFAASKISKNNFQVSVRNGVATLSGRTDIVQHKGTATRIAKAAGARVVENKIQISDAARHKSAENLARARKATVKQN